VVVVGCSLVIVTVGFPLSADSFRRYHFTLFLYVQDCWSTHEKTSGEVRDMFLV